MSSQRLKVQLGVASDTQEHGLGELHVTEDGRHFRYMQADGAVVADTLYNYVAGTWQIDAQIDLGVNPATAETKPLCASSVTLTDNQYTWVFVGPGEVTLTTAAAVAADAIIYGHATAGLVDDAATALLIDGLSAQTLIGSATTGTFYAARPLQGLDLA